MSTAAQLGGPTVKTGCLFQSLLLACLPLAYVPAAGAVPFWESGPQIAGREVEAARPPQQMKGQERSDLAGYYRAWLEEDVIYIIHPVSRASYEKLPTDLDREQFIELFWMRRDPTPETHLNEFRESHYKRILYANEHFGEAKIGWRTDRGHVYIFFGPPDEIETLPRSHGDSRHLVVWRYRMIAGMREDIEFHFHRSSSGSVYVLREEDRQLLDPGPLGVRFRRRTQGSDTKDKIRIVIGVAKPPLVRFRHLEELDRTRIVFKHFPVIVQTRSVKITEATRAIYVVTRLRREDLTFGGNIGRPRAEVEVFGRIWTESGRIQETFENLFVTVKPRVGQGEEDPTVVVLEKMLIFRPASYELHLVVKDVISGKIGTLKTELTVPK